MASLFRNNSSYLVYISSMFQTTVSTLFEKSAIETWTMCYFDRKYFLVLLSAWGGIKFQLEWSFILSLYFISGSLFYRPEGWCKSLMNTSRYLYVYMLCRYVELPEWNICNLKDLNFFKAWIGFWSVREEMSAFTFNWFYAVVEGNDPHKDVWEK